MGLAQAMMVAGLGCRRGAAAEDVLAAIAAALAVAGRERAALAALATSVAKAGEAGLREAAATLGLELRALPEAALHAAAPRCLTRSARALDATGLPSLAEAAALAGAGEGARLLGPRVAAGRAATCALAEARP
ncbi:cobalamin biosynthesis protein [Roseococcus thiosulfatophilus]|uniref:cobalamin biosynthesis protein n=1 Tax=Roseococcus thiosulfatophilus TaxID=35813 RepID=UPI001F5CAB5C|nr:cobalamin biosynthesis protein [Roseococcus thiosulfatophilus]